MNFDFALLLVIGTALTGAVWFCHRVFVGRSTMLVAAAPALPRREPRLVEYSRVLFPVALIVLLVRSFVFEPYRIPSPSMVPTLLVGDYIIVSKSSYGLRLPVLNWQIFETGEPRRGDVVVFRLPADPSINYIKRVIGLPNDRIVYRDHELFVNGVRVEVQMSDAPYTGDGAPDARLGTEYLDGHGHPIVHLPSRHAEDTEDFERTVPDGHYFVMGDNRDNSQDSRSPEVGFVPEDHLVGKAVMVWLNTRDLDRAGDRIR